ncbi:MAG: Flp family type IVb pilin [Agromyces sp.]
MKNLMYKAIGRWEAIKNDQGATAVEYALMVSLIAVVIIVAVTLLGGNLSKVFSGVAGKLTPPA